MVFSLTMILPGSAAVMELGQYATDEQVEALEQEMGLDKPAHVQYVDWMGGIMQGNFGESTTYNEPAQDVVAPRLVRSLQLAGLSFLFISIFGIGLGILTAVNRDNSIDKLTSIISYFGISFPEFVTGIILLYIFSGPMFGIFPIGGYEPLSNGFLSWLEHMVLPTLTLSIVMIAHVMRQTRSEMIDVLQSEYIRTARLKGLKEFDVLVKHALRNGLLPTITILGLKIGFLIGGVVVVEEVFTYPGIGSLVVTAIENRDIPLIQISVLIIAVGYTFANFAADLAYAYADPRIEYGGGE